MGNNELNDLKVEITVQEKFLASLKQRLAELKEPNDPNVGDGSETTVDIDILTSDEIQVKQATKKDTINAYVAEIKQIYATSSTNKNKNIDSILLNIFQVLGNISIKTLTISSENLLKFIKVSLFGLKPMNTDQYEISDDAKNLIEKINFSDLDINQALSKFNSVIMQIAKRESIFLKKRMYA
jgi:hypothetical protein